MIYAVKSYIFIKREKYHLSGGQAPEEATVNLNALNQQAANASWTLSVSFGRALQEPALLAWQGKQGNMEVAQKVLLKTGLP